MTELRYGILSTSSIAPRFIDAVRRANAGQILAVSSRQEETAREKAALWDIPTAYGSHAELLQDERINIVYISNVNAQHYEWAKAALEAGKHVVCEKPCTTRERQTEELFSLAEEKGLFFMEAQKMLFLPAINTLKEILESGVLGKVTMADLRHSFKATYNVWLFNLLLGGGTLLSSGIYVTELLAWLFGKVEVTDGEMVCRKEGAEEQYVFTGFAGDVQFVAQNSAISKLDNCLRIGGQQGWVEVPEYWKARKLILHLEGEEPKVMEFPCENELVYEASHIENCIREGRITSPVVTKELTLAGIRALEQAKHICRRRETA